MGDSDSVFTVYNMETWHYQTISVLVSIMCVFVCACMCTCMFVCAFFFGVCVCAEESVEEKAWRIVPQPKNISKCVSERVSMIHKLTTPKQVCALHSFICLWD